MTSQITLNKETDESPILLNVETQNNNCFIKRKIKDLYFGLIVLQSRSSTHAYNAH